VLSVLLCNKSLQFVTGSVVRKRCDCFAVVVEDYLAPDRYEIAAKSRGGAHQPRAATSCSLLNNVSCDCRDVGLNFAKLYHSLEQSLVWSRIDNRIPLLWGRASLRGWQGCCGYGVELMQRDDQR
jgi:hypothetical protein